MQKADSSRMPTIKKESYKILASGNPETNKKNNPPYGLFFISMERPWTRHGD